MKIPLVQKMISLWKEFLPLSVSDVTMALGDPLVNTTLAQMPRLQTNLAALGVVKALVVLFESPIIMLLHTSNTLAKKEEAQATLWKFVLLSCTILTFLLCTFAIPAIFFPVAAHIMGISGDLAKTAHNILLCLLLWPASIAWRRYFQGILISHGQLKPIARAGFIRLIVLFICLIVGFKAELDGGIVAGLAMIIGVFSEAIAITFSGWKYRKLYQSNNNFAQKPMQMKELWQFYWPLAHSMVLVWGGRALLIACLARAIDGPLALATWSVTWALVLVFANATRMVQQVIIRNKHKFHPADFILFAFSVGAILSGILLFSSLSRAGSTLLGFFVGQDVVLLSGVQHVILFCFAVPILIAIQNVFQGLLMGCGKTKQINHATLLGVVILLGCALSGIIAGFLGAPVAALSMIIALSSEIIILAYHVPWKIYVTRYLEQKTILEGSIA